MTEEIRFYLGKYKVRLLPRECPKWKPHSRVVEFLEECPLNAIEMMLYPGDQYMTSTRHLHLQRDCVDNSSQEKQKGEV